MSLHLTSGGARATVGPRFQSAPHRMSAARRTHIHGKLQPLPVRPERSRGALVAWGRTLPTTALCLAVTVLAALIFALPFALEAL